MLENWTFNELDEKIAGEIAHFLPERIFDSHAHIWRKADLEGLKSGAFTEGPEETTIEVWREHIGRHVGRNRLAGGLFLGLPMCNMDRMNSFLADQLKDEPESRGLICISPEYPKEKTLEYLESPLVAGFKPYHIFSKEVPTFQSSISGFLPEWAWEMADDRGLVITLHIVKDLALADPENQREIRAMCRKYPNARLILAHAARGFHAPNTMKGLA